MPPVETKPNIEITFTGLVMAFPSADNKTCSVGLLRDAPAGHALEVEVFKLRDGQEPERIALVDQAKLRDLEIFVNKTGITRRKMDVVIDRKNVVTEIKDSFKWVLDFEGELYKKPIGAKRSGFVSLLTLNNGELLTRKLSDNDLIIRRGASDAPDELVGRVAVRTGIDIVLDQPDSRAVFKNGNDIIFEADRNSKFEILIDRGCSNHPGNDADSYYTAVGHLLAPSEKIYFSSTPMPPPVAGVAVPTDPDAKCLVGQMTESGPE